MAHRLNTDNVPPHRRGQWYPLTVRRVLLNVAYTGRTSWGCKTPSAVCVGRISDNLGSGGCTTLLYLRLLTDTLRRTGTRRRDLLWENLALRQQLAIYQRQTHRPPVRQRDRLFWFLLIRRWTGWRGALVFVQPETIIR